MVDQSLNPVTADGGKIYDWYPVDGVTLDHATLVRSANENTTLYRADVNGFPCVQLNTTYFTVRDGANAGAWHEANEDYSVRGTLQAASFLGNVNKIRHLGI